MIDHSLPTINKRNIWLRGLYMLLMGLAYQLTGTLLFSISVIQFVVTLINQAPITRLQTLGRSLGLYVQHIVKFLSFDTEEVPFPFSDWLS